jgi:pyruvate,water dikinase
MTVATSVSSSAHVEDWNAGIEPGKTFRFDPMHFPYPMTSLSTSTMGPAFSKGATAGFRELQLPIDNISVVHRNHYRFECWAMKEPKTEEEARQIGETAEASIQREIGRMKDRWQNEHLPYIIAQLLRLESFEVASASPTTLSTLLNEAHAIHEDMWRVHFLIAGPMLLSIQVFDELYADLFGADEAEGHALLVGELSESVKAGIGLSDLAIAAKDLGLAGLILETDDDQLTETLEASESGRAFLDQLASYLEAYGLRQDLFEFSTPTWREDPSIALANVRNYLQTGHDARAEQAEQVRRAEAALAAARERLAGFPEPVRGQFEAMVQFARGGSFLQEEHNYYIDQRMTALLRLFYLQVGQRFVDAGLLDSADDVFFMEKDELHDALIGLEDPAAFTGLRDLVAQRRAELAFAATLTPPPFIGEMPAGPPPADNPMDRAMMRFFGGAPQQAEQANQLKGNPGSRGIATGIARVARTLDEARHLQPGEILVAMTTMPAWTPLFGVAAAVVTETGGALSHCAIVAREYAIPAVVGAAGATQRIATGQRVTVDGSAGLITILE